MFEVGRNVRVTLGGGDYCVYRDDEWYMKTVEGCPKIGDTGMVTGYETGFAEDKFAVVRLDSPATPRNGIGDDGWRFLDEWLEPVEEA